MDQELKVFNFLLFHEKVPAIFHTTWENLNLDCFMSNTVFILLQFHEKSTRIFSHNMGKTKSWLFHAYYFIWTLSISREKYPHFFTKHGKNQILTVSCLILYFNSFHLTKKNIRNFSHNMGKTKSWLFHAYYYCISPLSISRKKYPHFFTQHDSLAKLTIFDLT